MTECRQQLDHYLLRGMYVTDCGSVPPFAFSFAASVVVLPASGLLNGVDSGTGEEAASA